MRGRAQAGPQRVAWAVTRQALAGCADLARAPPQRTADQLADSQKVVLSFLGRPRGFEFSKVVSRHMARGG